VPWFTVAMAYLKPPLLVGKIYNKIALAVGANGSEKLTVTGRKTGAPQSIPVVPVDFEGSRYLVSTRGESQWVRNVRANPTVTLASKHGATTFSAVEVPPVATASIIQAYRQKAGKSAEACWEKLPDGADHPVFKLTPQG
jgi:deazaflavin-dependent oxidoreductase (nitroreductase family)